MSLDRNSILVNVSISMWSGRKLDREVSQEIDVTKSTKTRAGNYNKNLFAGVDELEKVKQVAGRIRVWFASQTMPWSDGGDRLLPMANFQDFKQELVRLEQEFNDAVKVFCDRYANLISSQAFTLGALFDRDDYPTADRIASKFELRYTFSPVPDVGDWRVVSDDSVRQELDQHYRKAYEDRIKAASLDLWERLHACLKHMADRLTDADEGKRKVIRESMLANAMELCALLTKLNVVNDPYLEATRKSLESLLVGVTTEDLRNSAPARKELKIEVDAILKRFDF
jgi:hypothetical protein